jgi:putative colanic acid biosynthesis glycosyltransferase
LSVRFSIITVTYQNLAGLQKTARSVAAQTCRDFEWIVVDGGSNDGTVEFLKTLSNAQWRSEPDKGIYDAMNKGIARSTGDYLLFLNAGDAFATPDVLDRLSAAILQQKSPLDFIYGDALEERLGDPPAYKTARSADKILWGLVTHHQAMLYRRAALGALRYDQTYKIAADYKLTLQFLKGEKALKVPFPLCLFESGGVSQRRVLQGRCEQFSIRRETKACSLAFNVLIFAAQTASYTLRHYCPALYWLLRQGGNKAPVTRQT